MTEERTSRSRKDLRATSIDQLQLPTRYFTTPNGQYTVPTRSRAGFGRSPSPVPTPAFNFEGFNFDAASSSNSAATMSGLMAPPSADASIEEVRRYADALRQQALAFSESLATTTQLLTTALSTNSSRVSSKKPELPPFDANNLEPWIRRTENAFLRASITDPKLKFAYLENIISVELHPTINSYFQGEATQANYDSLLAFLRERYGRTKQQKVRAAIEGVRRKGRTPSDLVALLKEQVGNITINDILTSHFLAELPQSVRSQLTDKIDTLSLEELAKAADAHFNQDGTLRASQSHVNSVASESDTAHVGLPQPTSFSTPYEDDSRSTADVNYINRRAPNSNRHSNASGSGSGRGNGNGYNSRSRNASGARGARNRSSSRPNPSTSPNSNPDWCWAHNKFGNDARTCKSPCVHPKSTAAQQQQNRGNVRGGRR